MGLQVILMFNHGYFSAHLFVFFVKYICSVPIRIFDNAALSYKIR